MAKKASNARKPSGVAGIAIVGDDPDHDEVQSETSEAHSDSSVNGAQHKRKAKGKADQQSNGHVGVSDIKKAVGFVNSVGGLEKAIAVLQILKVAKEVQ